jgi:predicted nucleic acid-binding protein
MDPVRSWDETRPVVADASVWINLVASGRAPDILGALPLPLQIPRIALDELERGRDKGRVTAERIEPLIAAGLVAVMHLAESAEEIYLSLVAGSVRQTLDDGEAATLALALQAGGAAIIDERKAISLAALRFPDLRIISTTDLLMSGRLHSVLSRADLADVLYAALVDARMRVPDHLLDEVCELLGPSRILDCPSLPARVRPAVQPPNVRPATSAKLNS